MTLMQKKKLIIGITGASGIIYGIRILEEIRKTDLVETHLVVTEAGLLTLSYETDMNFDTLKSLADNIYDINDIAAPIASGSFRTDGMVIAPCSMKTLSSIANSISSNLLIRAADVCLKERRKLLLMVRETPFHLGHLRAMTLVTEMGGIVMPPLPAFYCRPKTIEDVINQSVGRALDLFDIESQPPINRWGKE